MNVTFYQIKFNGNISFNELFIWPMKVLRVYNKIILTQTPTPAIGSKLLALWKSLWLTTEP